MMLIQSPNLLFPGQQPTIIILRRLSVDVVWLQLFEPASLHHNISGAKTVYHLICRIPPKMSAHI